MASEKRRGVYSLPAYAGWSNQQLTKNCGIVPYLFYKKFGFHAVMAGAKVEPSYPYLQYVEGMDVDFLPDGEVATKLGYIRSHAGDIDLLILHGYYPNYVDMVKCYRDLRPDGKIYLELDINLQAADRTPWRSEKVAAMLGACDVIGAASRSMQRYMARKTPYRIEYIPNGFYDFGADFAPDFSAKENVILTVGRIGTHQKNNELLLEAFAAAADDMPGWSVRLVGRVEDGFRPYMQAFFARFPALRERISFAGLVEDRQAVAEEYKRAKIFALTSRMENSANVLAEALAGGDYIVTSDVDGTEDAVDDGRCGEVFPSEDAGRLAEILRGLARDGDRIGRGGRHAVRHVRQAFDYDSIVDRLYYLLYGVCGA